MTTFYYEAVDKDNSIKSGEKVATNEEEVASFLKLKNYTIITIEQKKGDTYKSKKISEIITSGDISIYEKADFARNLATMIKSGLPIAEAIGVISEETQSKKFKTILNDIKYDLESGQPLSRAMGKFSDVFDSVFVSLVAAGEVSGKMPEVLTSLYKHMARNIRLRNKIISAFTYPIVVLIALGIMGIIMLIIVVPKILDVFSRMNISLPFALRALQALSIIFINYWYLSYPIIIVLVILVIFFLKSKSGKKVRSYIIQKIPYLSKISKNYDLARFSSTMALLLRSGVPMTDSLKITSEGLINIDMKQSLLNSEKQVKEGTALSKAFESHQKNIPNMMIKIVKVGEKSGKMDQVLDELGKYYNSQVDFQLKTVSDLVEPVLMLVVGILVAALVLSIIAPIYNIIGNFSGR